MVIGDEGHMYSINFQQLVHEIQVIRRMLI